MIQNIAFMFFDLPPIYFIIALNYSLMKEERERVKSNFGISDSERSAAAIRAALLGSFKSSTQMEVTIASFVDNEITVEYTDIESERNSDIDRSLEYINPALDFKPHSSTFIQ
jgi:hypothetical protein